MFNYDKYPLNAWVYGLLCLFILMLPIFCFMGNIAFGSIENILNNTDGFFESYLNVMLFPNELSMRWLFQIPYLGVLLAIASYALHVHIYCLLIERSTILFRKKKSL